MDNTDLDVLAVELLRAQKLLRDARYNVDVIESEILRHLKDNGVAEVRTEHYTLAEKPPVEVYEWSDTLGLTLKSLMLEGKLAPDEVDTLYTPVTTHKVATSTLLKLARKRGFTERLKDLYRKVPRGVPHVDVKEVD